MNSILIGNIMINLAEIQYVDWTNNRCFIKFRGETAPREILVATGHDRERLNDAMQTRHPLWVYTPDRWWQHLPTVWGMTVCVLVALFSIFGFRR